MTDFMNISSRASSNSNRFNMFTSLSISTAVHFEPRNLYQSQRERECVRQVQRLVEECEEELKKYRHPIPYICMLFVARGWPGVNFICQQLPSL
jgi:hypothetical protein